MPQTTIPQRVAMMNGAHPSLTEYVDGLEDAIRDLITWAEIMGGWESQAWERAAQALHAADDVNR
jgi:hypothetical protein